MRRNFIHTILVTLILLVCNTIFAQDVRVIDNKGTRKIINKVSYGTLEPSTTSTPLVPNNTHQKGDVYIIGDVYAQDSVYVFDGAQWVSMLSETLVMGHFIIEYGDVGLKKITGLPFKPSMVTFIAHTNIGEETINESNDVGYDNAWGIANSFGKMNGYAIGNNSVTSQQVVYLGAHGNSINCLSRYASVNNCIGLRFSDRDGRSLGLITASLVSFDTTSVLNNGFTLNVDYVDGSYDNSHLNILRKVRKIDVRSRKVLVMYTAHK